jgi:hypothetical protein
MHLVTARHSGKTSRRFGTLGGYKQPIQIASGNVAEYSVRAVLPGWPAGATSGTRTEQYGTVQEMCGATARGTVC